MIFVDFKRTDQELSQDISNQCSEFGVVNSVKIHRGPKQFAIVEMATHEAALNLSAHFRRTSIGNGVLIYLEQKE
jgi:hypothetical protein